MMEFTYKKAGIYAAIILVVFTVGFCTGAYSAKGFPFHKTHPQVLNNGQIEALKELLISFNVPTAVVRDIEDRLRGK